MYLLGEIEKFAAMPKPDVKKIAFEVATLGMKGFDVNDSTQKYQLRSLPAPFSGLRLVCSSTSTYPSLASIEAPRHSKIDGPFMVSPLFLNASRSILT